MSPSPAAGYSGTPQQRKLGVLDGVTVAVIGRPRGWTFEEPLPHGAELKGQARAGAADIVLAFVSEPSGLSELNRWGEQVFPSGAVWLAWPRRAGGHLSDMTEDLIREAALPLGLVDVKVAAIDTDWSGLKLVWRKELRHPPRQSST